MRVLVACGSKRGGTAGIAEWIAVELRFNGIEAEAREAAASTDLTPYGAVIIGGALYAGRWHRAARRFARRHRRALVHLPVWAFSSGPLDRTAEEGTLGPSPSVAGALARIGAQSHATFGGRLLPDTRGFAASALAKQHGGDFRDREQVRAWARGIAAELAAFRGQAVTGSRPARRPCAGEGGGRILGRPPCGNAETYAPVASITAVCGAGGGGGIAGHRSQAGPRSR